MPILALAGIIFSFFPISIADAKEPSKSSPKSEAILVEPHPVIEGTPEQRWKLLVLEGTANLKKGDCSKAWMIFFGNSISENGEIAYQARRKLYNLIFSENTLDSIDPPGLSNDILSRTHHALVLSLHSKPALIENNAHPALGFIEDHLPNTEEKRSFFSCVESDPNKDCSDILVNANLIPDYFSYFKEVQLLWSAGIRSNCSTHIIK